MNKFWESKVQKVIIVNDTGIKYSNLLKEHTHKQK